MLKKKSIDKEKIELSLDNIVVGLWQYDGKVRHWISEIQCKRVPGDDGVVKIVSEDVGFDQPFPEDEDEDVVYKIGDILKNVDDLKIKKKKILDSYQTQLTKNSDDKKKKTKFEYVNIKDVDHEIKLWIQRLRDVLYSGKSSYSSIKNGKLYLEFVRVGSTYVPLKADLFTGTIWSPSNIRKGMRRSLDHNKKTFYKANKSMKTLFAILVISVVVLLGISAYFNYKFADLINNNKLAEITQTCTDGFIESAEILKEIALNVEDATSIERQVRYSEDPTGSGGSN